jgi:hypothetical protein
MVVVEFDCPSADKLVDYQEYIFINIKKKEYI